MPIAPTSGCSAAGRLGGASLGRCFRFEGAHKLRPICRPAATRPNEWLLLEAHHWASSCCESTCARRDEAALLSAASVPRRGTGRRARARWSRRRGSSAAIRSGPARAGAERRPASALCRRPCLGHCEAARNAAAVRAAGCARRAGVKPRAERRQSPHGRPGLASVLAGSGRAAVSCP